MVAVQTFLEVMHTRAEFAMWVSLWSDGLFVLRTRLTTLFWFPCNVSRKLVTVLMKTDAELVVPCVLRSLRKPKHLISILNCPWHFSIPSLHVHLEHWEDTLQTLQFVCWEGNSKWTCWCARVLCCVYPLPSPIFKRYKSAVLLSICKWIAIFDCLFVNVRIANLAAIDSRTFICKFSYFSDHFPSVDTPKGPQPDFDASVCITKFGSFCLSDLPLFNLKFLTHQRSSCFDMNRLGLVIVFVVVVSTLAVDEQAELLGQLRRSDLSILLIPKRWFESEKEDSGISSFPLLVPKSWCGYLFLDLKSLFVVMVSELIFSALWQNPDVEVEKSICLGSLKIRLFFPSEEYRRDISLGECSAVSVELLVPLMVLKISWEQALIQNKGRETQRDFPTKQISQTSFLHAQWHWEIGIFQIYLAEKIVFLEKVFQAMQTFHFEMLVWNKLVESF